MASDVFFHSLAQDPGLEFAPVDPRPGLAELVNRLGLEGAAQGSGPWGLKVSLGGQGHPPAVDPGWARGVADSLAGTETGLKNTFCFDTLSITTGGLDREDTHLGLAQAKGFGADKNGLEFRVADGPGPGSSLEATLKKMTGVCLLTPVRPHPHAGFQGALFNLGVGLADREAKIELHRDIRPNVDTPLCAGCGSCLAVCLFDAIAINAGRAFIDHTKCTGCGECMNVCFMAGISAEEAEGIPRFQARVAGAARQVEQSMTADSAGRLGYFNFLVRLDRHAGGARARGRQRLGDVGILASPDPVALDKATWDFITERTDGPLSAWSGFRQEPGVLLGEAEKLGLGTTAYRIIEV
jgi:ferredoxin